MPKPLISEAIRLGEINCDLPHLPHHLSQTNAEPRALTNSTNSRPYFKLGDVPQELSDISGAIIDLKVGGVLAYALIDRLLEMNIPITLYTGYDVHCCPKKYAELSRVIKPLPCVEAVKDLVRQLATLSAQQSPVLSSGCQPARIDLQH